MRCHARRWKWKWNIFQEVTKMLTIWPFWISIAHSRNNNNNRKIIKSEWEVMLVKESLEISFFSLIVNWISWESNFFPIRPNFHCIKASHLVFEVKSNNGTHCIVLFEWKNFGAGSMSVCGNFWSLIKIFILY
jgi:hypothetical protein